MNAWKNSYWNGKGKFKTLAEKLDGLIPESGECTDPNGANKALDKFRRARNCYYDLFNNGLGNRAAEFRKVFKFSPRSQYTKFTCRGREIDAQNEDLNARLNDAMDEFILVAAKEQGLEIFTVESVGAWVVARSNELNKDRTGDGNMANEMAFKLGVLEQTVASILNGNVFLGDFEKEILAISQQA